MKSKSVAAVVMGREKEMVEAENMQPLASSPCLEKVRQRAYELHLERGCVHGWDQDDWLQAERDLMEKYQAR
jgi:hypothetical protein